MPLDALDQKTLDSLPELSEIYELTAFKSTLVRE